MGWSCTAMACYSLESITRQLQERGKDSIDSQTGWKYKGSEYFYECGREHADGSITGAIWKKAEISGDKFDHFIRRAGSLKIAGNGEIIRFATSTKAMRNLAKADADVKYKLLIQDVSVSSFVNHRG